MRITTQLGNSAGTVLACVTVPLGALVNLPQAFVDAPSESMVTGASNPTRLTPPNTAIIASTAKQNVMSKSASVDKLPKLSASAPKCTTRKGAFAGQKQPDSTCIMEKRARVEIEFPTIRRSRQRIGICSWRLVSAFQSPRI